MPAASFAQLIRGGNSKLDLARFAIGSFNADSRATEGRGGKELGEITLAFHLPFPFFRRHYDGGLAGGFWMSGGGRRSGFHREGPGLACRDIVSESKTSWPLV